MAAVSSLIVLLRTRPQRDGRVPIAAATPWPMRVSMKQPEGSSRSDGAISTPQATASPRREPHPAIVSKRALLRWFFRVGNVRIIHNSLTDLGLSVTDLVTSNQRLGFQYRLNQVL